jgi:flagellar basal body-associated protein FliL
MRDWIAVIITVLGVLLVLAGATLILLRALPARQPAPVAAATDPDAVTEVVPDVAPEPAPITARLSGAWKSPTPADRLIFWGIVLLVLAAIAAGAITFNLGAAGGATPATR